MPDTAEAKAQREHEITQREAAAALQQRDERRQTITRWRTALQNAADDEHEWEVKDWGDIVRPNLIVALWFEELRPHLGGRYDAVTRINATPETVTDLPREIARIEREWLND
jgi:hypothetical protein